MISQTKINELCQDITDDISEQSCIKTGINIAIPLIEKEMIFFNQWVIFNGWYHFSGLNVYQNTNSPYQKTYKDLLELYKQEKGLSDTNTGA